MDVDYLLRVQNLTKYFSVNTGVFAQIFSAGSDYVKAVDGISFDVRKGETLGIVGESGCGKSTAGLTILQLLSPTAGDVIFSGESIVDLPSGRRRLLRKNLQMILQNPYSSLNPRMRIRDILAEPLNNFESNKRKQQAHRIAELLDYVGLTWAYSERFPHELSGGQRQRIGIARALALQPRLIVADEPVSALDVSVQSQILNLLLKLKEQFGLTYLFISHDLAVVRYISDRVAVMYLGQIIELGLPDSIYREPLHPYTKALISAIPEPDPHYQRERIVLSGGVPSPINPPSGCRFHTRCPIAVKRCSQEVPTLRLVAPDRQVMCHLIQ